MNMLAVKLWLLLFFTLSYNAHGAKILAIFHFPCQSHHILGSTLLKALAKRGHQITMVSPFPLETPVENYTDIEITGVLEYKEKNIVPKFLTAHSHSMYDKMTFSIKNSQAVAELFLNHPNIKQLLSSNQRFDLVIVNWAMNEALLAIGHHFQAPTVVFSTIGPSHLTNKITRNPAPYAFTPNLFLTYSDDMTFLQRLSNVFWSTAFELVDYYVNEGIQREILANYFPNAPPLEKLIDNVSLVLLNSHYGIENARPYVPNMIEIGGFHLQEPQGLTGKVKEFLDSAHEGVLFFSLGTNVKSSHLPEAKILAIVEAFASLKVKVLWKFENYFQNLPENVMTNEWLPQTDILAHPNVKVFVTHGGRLSTIEAVYHGVPIIGIPFFSDQEYNIASAINNGYGIKVDFTTLTKETLSQAINEILYNSKYKENAQRRSKIIKDVPLKSLDNAIFWVEYVIRHRGADHLKTSALKLHWWQRLLIDVLAFVAGITIFGLAGICLLFCRIFRFMKLRTRVATKQKTR